MRPLSPQFRPYGWALSAREIAGRAGIAPEDVLRFDGNTPPEPPPTARPETIASALERIQSYRHGGFPELLQRDRRLQRRRAGERRPRRRRRRSPDALRRAYAGPGDRVAIADEPSYPLYRVAAWVTGADVGDDAPVLTVRLPAAQPDRRPRRDPGCAPARRGRGVLRVRRADGGAACRRRRDRRAHVLEGVRARVGARRLRARGRRDCAAELNERQQPAPSRRSPPRSRSQVSRRAPPDVSRDDRRARAARGGCARSASSRFRP